MLSTQLIPTNSLSSYPHCEVTIQKKIKLYLKIFIDNVGCFLEKTYKFSHFQN